MKRALGITILELVMLLMVLALLMGGFLEWREWASTHAPEALPHTVAVSPRST
jgi:hypothetical protein